MGLRKSLGGIAEGKVVIVISGDIVGRHQIGDITIEERDGGVFIVGLSNPTEHARFETPGYLSFGNAQPVREQGLVPARPDRTITLSGELKPRPYPRD